MLHASFSPAHNRQLPNCQSITFSGLAILSSEITKQNVTDYSPTADIQMQLWFSKINVRLNKTCNSARNSSVEHKWRSAV